MNFTGTGQRTWIGLRMREAERALGMRRRQINRLVREGRLRTFGRGPGKRVSIESIQASGMALQQELPLAH